MHKAPQKDVSISLVGSGNIAWHLGHALKQSSYTLNEVISRNQKTGEELASDLGCLFTQLSKPLVLNSDIYIIAVADKALEGIAEQLTGTKALLLHTAGSIPMDVFQKKADRYGVLYPYQTFTKGVPLDFSTVPLCVEASSEGVLLEVEALAKALSTVVQRISSEQRKVLHIAGIMANNFTNHLMARAGELLGANRIDDKLLIPLVEETINKLKKTTAREAQSGPARRNDSNVIASHLEFLSDFPDLKNLYSSISDSIIAFYSKEQK